MVNRQKHFASDHETEVGRLSSISPHPGVARTDDGLRPVGYLQLDQYVGDVVPNRFQAHEQLPGYLLVALALRNQGEDLLFALGEFRKGALRRG
jgi:hypothetical protein